MKGTTSAKPPAEGETPQPEHMHDMRWLVERSPGCRMAAYMLIYMLIACVRCRNEGDVPLQRQIPFPPHPAKFDFEAFSPLHSYR